MNIIRSRRNNSIDSGFQNLRGPQLSYKELQRLRYTRVVDALQDDTATADDLVRMYGVAHKGLSAVVTSRSALEDARVFWDLEARVSERLQESPAVISAKAFLGEKAVAEAFYGKAGIAEDGPLPTVLVD